MLLTEQEHKYIIHHDMERSESLVLEKLRRIISGPFLTASRSSFLFLSNAAAQQLAVLTSTLRRACLSQAASTESCWKVLVELAESLVTPHPPRILNHGCLQMLEAISKGCCRVQYWLETLSTTPGPERETIFVPKETFLEQDSSLWTRASSCLDSKETISYVAGLCGNNMNFTSSSLSFVPSFIAIICTPAFSLDGLLALNNTTCWFLTFPEPEPSQCMLPPQVS